MTKYTKNQKITVTEKTSIAGIDVNIGDTLEITDIYIHHMLNLYYFKIGSNRGACSIRRLESITSPNKGGNMSFNFKYVPSDLLMCSGDTHGMKKGYVYRICGTNIVKKQYLVKNTVKPLSLWVDGIDLEKNVCGCCFPKGTKLINRGNYNQNGNVIPASSEVVVHNIELDVNDEIVHTVLDKAGNQIQVSYNYLLSNMATPCSLSTKKFNIHDKIVVNDNFTTSHSTYEKQDELEIHQINVVGNNEYYVVKITGTDFMCMVNTSQADKKCSLVGKIGLPFESPFPSDIGPNQKPKEHLCTHQNKKKVQLVYSAYWYCPDCKADLGDA